MKLMQSYTLYCLPKTRFPNTVDEQDILSEIQSLNQGCGSGLDPDSVTLRILIRIGNPDPGSGSRGKKVKKFQGENVLLVF
jgi:hypothetical protein